MTDTPRLTIRRAAVLGAGVMGAQIAAHLANADVPVLLYDLAASDGPPEGIARASIARLGRLEPAPLATPGRAAHIEPASYAHDLARLGDCDLVIEAIAEKLEWKTALYAQVAPHLRADAVFASNTSGLSIATLAAALPAGLRARFCGMHFFNPPRYLPLVELIRHPDSDPQLLDALETWLTSWLGKHVLRAPDTPNFIANRVGVFSMLAVLRHTQTFGLGLDEVDALTGPAIGRPKSATYRTADVVGLDTLAHVVDTLRSTLPEDPWRASFTLPDWLQALIARGALGQKTGAGIYRKDGRTIRVLDPASADYRDSRGTVAAEVAAILARRDPVARFAALRASAHPQARFLWAIFRDLFHYCAVHLADIADSARDIDCALRWGFGWALGPFETWQAAGWRAVAEAIEADRVAGRTLSDAPLPAWVPALEGVHTPAGSYSPRRGSFAPRSTLAVYARQLCPERLLGEAAPEAGETLFENAGARLWRRPDIDARIGVLSFTSKMHALTEPVLAAIHAALDLAEAQLDGLVLWQRPPFAVGADLRQMRAEVMAVEDGGDPQRLDDIVAFFQRTALRLKYARVPVVAAIDGLALGGGCEFAMQVAHRVFALEAPIGLVEAGVGLIPAGGGCKEFVLRAARIGAQTANRDPFAAVQTAFLPIATAQVAKNAREAQEIGFAQPSDDVLLAAAELPYVAIRRARALAETGYRPPLPPRAVPVAGRDGIATLEMLLVNLRAGGQISEHDYRIGRALAEALCGGAVDPGTCVDETWLLGLERRLFVELLQTPETQARIAHMLETGKPLRN
ncbi:3-hydroxyacyl-CoA dehydrogenase/enoyl-CoA hydratase family protein [Plasticicumulans sp.]|uniref:3-hydroxyacyl-CoA dehydrogenase/enoyl-CoA hydratase family protein n=1 Tax=Plasticicumulans sp. TaxID=2307179 RepID=UPI0039267F45